MKTLIWDIEIMHSYDESYQARLYTGWIDRSVRMSADVSYVSHIGYKWLGEKDVYCLDLSMDPNFDRSNPTASEKWLLSQAVSLFKEADHLVAHFGDAFDRRYLTAKFLKHKLPTIPHAPLLKQTDTCKLARQHLKLSSNRLDNIASFLGVAMKKSKNWPDDWIKMTKGELGAFKRVNVYCKGDVVSLEEVFLILRAFAKGIPNRNVEEDGDVCPVCSSGDYVKYGFAWCKKKKYQRFRCKNCGHPFDERDL